MMTFSGYVPPLSSLLPRSLFQQIPTIFTKTSHSHTGCPEYSTATNCAPKYNTATHCVLKYTVSPENTRLCCGPWNWKCSLPGILTCPSSHSVIKRWRSGLFWPGLASAEPHRWQNDAPASKEKCRRSRESIYPLYMQFSSWKWIQLKIWPGIPGWHPTSPWFPETAVILTGHIPPLVTGLLSEELLCPCTRTILTFLNAQYYGRNIGFN